MKTSELERPSKINAGTEEVAAWFETLYAPGSPFDGMTLEKMEMMNEALYGQRVRVTSSSPHRTGSDDHIFSRVVMPRHQKGLIPSEWLFQDVGDLILYDLGGSSSYRVLGMGACTSFEIVGEEYLNCSYCSRFKLRSELFNEDANWHGQDGDQPRYRLECRDCVDRW